MCQSALLPSNVPSLPNTAQDANRAWSTSCARYRDPRHLRPYYQHLALHCSVMSLCAGMHFYWIPCSMQSLTQEPLA